MDFVEVEFEAVEVCNCPNCNTLEPSCDYCKKVLQMMDEGICDPQLFKIFHYCSLKCREAHIAKGMPKKGAL
jgi:hypothetical protein